MDVKLNPQSAKLLADIRGYLALNEQQRKVIEAAKALEASLDHPEKDYQGVLKVALAVRALQEVE